MSGIADHDAGPRGFAESNPNFGKGALRRRIRLIAHDDSVEAGVEDDYHSFRLRLQHDSERITAIEPQFLRFPLSTCPGASAPLQRLIGLHLGTPWRGLVSAEDPSMHCTHLFDLALLAMAHARRGGVRDYEVCIPDEHPAAVWSTLQRDGIEVIRWKTFKGAILEPHSLAGRPLMRGFSRWASATFEGESLEAAMVFHKGYFVSRARPWNVEFEAGKSVAHHVVMKGACHSYHEPNMSIAIREGSMTIDTSDAGTKLLLDMD